MNQYISVHVRDGVMSIRLNRPDNRNALDGPMFEALADAFTDARSDDHIYTVLISGTPECFCAGHDLASFATLWPQSENGAIVRCVTSLLGLDKPLVAAVCGAAVGFGATLLLSADYVVASYSSAFRFPFARLGIVPEAGASVLLARRVGDLCARDWLMSARVVDAYEAVSRGLVSMLAETSEVDSIAQKYAEDMASKPARVMRKIRQLINDGANRTALQAACFELDELNLLIPEATARAR
jgi:enoyl-CoA hydratase/carnithine racemase